LPAAGRLLFSILENAASCGAPADSRERDCRCYFHRKFPLARWDISAAFVGPRGHSGLDKRTVPERRGEMRLPVERKATSREPRQQGKPPGMARRLTSRNRPCRGRVWPGSKRERDARVHTLGPEIGGVERNSRAEGEGQGRQPGGTPDSPPIRREVIRVELT